jgi:hypothetical protein
VELLAHEAVLVEHEHGRVLPTLLADGGGRLLRCCCGRAEAPRPVGREHLRLVGEVREAAQGVELCLGEVLGAAVAE